MAVHHRIVRRIATSQVSLQKRVEIACDPAIKPEIQLLDESTSAPESALVGKISAAALRPMG